MDLIEMLRVFNIGVEIFLIGTSLGRMRRLNPLQRISATALYLYVLSAMSDQIANYHNPLTLRLMISTVASSVALAYIYRVYRLPEPERRTRGGAHLE